MIIIPMELSTTTPIIVKEQDDFFDNIHDYDFFHFEDKNLLAACHAEYTRLQYDLPHMAVINNGEKIAALPAVYVSYEGVEKDIELINDINSIFQSAYDHLRTHFAHFGVYQTIGTLKECMMLLFPFYNFGLVSVSEDEVVASQSWFNYHPIDQEDLRDNDRIFERLNLLKEEFTNIRRLLSEKANAVFDHGYYTSRNYHESFYSQK